MATPHKHAELIKAWADGAVIQHFNSALGRWFDVSENKPRWNTDGAYRIKPEPKPDVVCDRRVFIGYSTTVGFVAAMDNNAISGLPNNVRFTFDGETNELKHAEVVK